MRKFKEFLNEWWILIITIISLIILIISIVKTNETFTVVERASQNKNIFKI